MSEQDTTQAKSQDELSDEQLETVAGGLGGQQPSGDADPSDLGNTTVDTSGVINPQK